MLTAESGISLCHFLFYFLVVSLRFRDTLERYRNYLELIIKLLRKLLLGKIDTMTILTMTLLIMTLPIMNLRIMTLLIMTLRIMTLCIMTYDFNYNDYV